MTRLEQIKNEITNVQGVYKFEETKKEVINFYSENEEKLNNISEEKFKNYSFLSEVLKKCELKEKQSKLKQLEKRVYRLCVHKYAPELNALNFLNNKGQIIEVKTPQKTDINSALTLILNNMSLTQIQNLIYNTKLIK